MNPLQIGVIGGGHLGTIHTRLASSLDGVELVGVAEPSAEARERIAAEFNVRVVEDYRELLPQMEAAIVATPTRFHHHIAMDLLRHDVHLLIEKPITASEAEASQLVHEAESRGRVLQVGHVEQFNPVMDAVRSQLTGPPRYIQAVRCGPYSFRSTDIGVVLDLMIHDLDLVLSLVRSKLVQVAAVGTAVMGPHEDMAQARLEFANGTVANLTASRTSPEAERRMDVYWDQGYAGIDFVESKVRLIRPCDQILEGKIDVDQLTDEQKSHMKEHLFRDYLQVEELPVERANAILCEQQDFVTAIRQGQPVRVPGGQALDAIAAAERILASIARHRWTDVVPVSPWPAGHEVPHRKAG